MLRTVLLLCMLALVAAGLTGCVATAAYVNIPAEAGDVARNSPDAENVREVEAAALRYLELDRPIDGNIAISLPGGASELTHADVARRAGSKFVPPGAAAEAAATMVVKSVRIRGFEAEIDITRPSRGGMHQLTTVYLRYTPTDGWFGERVRYWRGVGAFTPAPDLTAEEEPAMEEGSADEMVIEEEPVEEVPAEEAPVEEAPAVEQ